VDSEDSEDCVAAVDAVDSGVGGPAAPAPIGAPADRGDLDALRGQIATLESRVDELVGAAAREHERAAFRESVIDRLHAENQLLRRGELDAMFQPVRDGVVALHDLARRAAAQYRRVEAATAEQGAALLDTLAEEASDVLARLGVSRIEPVCGELFDPARHRGVGTAPAQHPWQDNTIVDVNATGFALAEKVIRRAEVVVARHHGGQGEEQR
jgi:molecular chaperone GrpE (heat shock protein)